MNYLSQRGQAAPATQPATPRPPAPSAGMPQPSMLPRSMPAPSSNSFEPAFPRAVRHGAGSAFPGQGAFPGGGATGGQFPGAGGPRPQMAGQTQGTPGAFPGRNAFPGQGATGGQFPGGAGGFQPGQMGPNAPQMPPHLQNIMRNGGSIDPNVMAAGGIGGNPVRPGGFGPQWGRSTEGGTFGPQAFGVPGGTGPMMPEDRAANRQQFLDGRNQWRGVRDDFRNMEPGEGRRAARDDFFAARDQFRDQQALGSGPPQGFPGQANPLANMQGPMIDMLRQLFSQRFGGMGI